MCARAASDGASGDLRCMCPNHLKRYWTSFSSIGATPTLSRDSQKESRDLQMEGLEMETLKA
uniref:Uncharacterized protein n=1 Tax=Arundo donax TaxID=35708 RepID=A0A0A9H926_ARUDO